MASLLTSEKNDIERIAFLIDDCKEMNIEVLAPDINESLKNFTVVPNKKKIRFGLLAIKNVGEGIIDSIVEERKKSGPFKSINDFVERMALKDLNKKSLESLIKTGALDKFGERKQLLENMERLLEFARGIKKNKANGQTGLFENHSFNKNIALLAIESPATSFEQLSWDKELLGLYVSSHPLESYREILKNKTFSIKNITEKLVNRKVIVGGIISNVKKIITKTGKPMLFVKLEDLGAKTEIIVFPGIFEKNPAAFQENKIVFIKGRIDNRNGSLNIIADNIEEIITS